MRELPPGDDPYLSANHGSPLFDLPGQWTHQDNGGAESEAFLESGHVFLEVGPEDPRNYTILKAWGFLIGMYIVGRWHAHVLALDAQAPSGAAFDERHEKRQTAREQIELWSKWAERWK